MFATTTRKTTQVSERGERALDEDENTRDESREMAADIMATSTTKLTLFHSIRLARLARFARAPLKMRLASLGEAQGVRPVQNAGDE